MSGARVTWPGYFSMEIPDGWTWSDEKGGVISVFPKSSGVGAFHISFARRNRSEAATARDAIELAQFFCRERGWEAEPRALASSPTGTPASWVGIDDDRDGRHWELWQIVDDKRAATITYNCRVKDAGVDADVRQAAVSSFRWESR